MVVGLVFKFAVRSFVFPSSVRVLPHLCPVGFLERKKPLEKEFTASCNVKPAKRKYIVGLIVVPVHAAKEDRFKKGRGEVGAVEFTGFRERF